MHLIMLATLLSLLVVPVAATAQGVPEQWRLSESLRIGSLDRQNYSLTEIGDISRAPNGDIVIALPMDRQIRVYDASGGYLMTIGRQGEGPGEFESISRLGWHGDKLLAVDPRLKRLSLFNEAREFVTSWTQLYHDLPPAFMPYPPLAVLRDGSLLFRPYIRPSAQDEVQEVPLARFDSAGRFLNEVGRLDWTPPPTTVLRVPTRSGSRMISFLANPVQYTTLWDVHPDGAALVLADQQPPNPSSRSTFRITRMTPTGDTLFHRAFSFEPERLPKGAWESHARDRTESLLSLASRFPVDEDDVLDEMGSAYPEPEYQGAIDRLVAGADGSIWLRRGSFGLDRAAWLVLDDEGELLARVALPTDVEIYWASKDAVLAVIEDELEVPYVVQYEVRK